MWIVRLALRRPYTFVIMAHADRHPRRAWPSSACPPTSSPKSISPSSASSGPTPASRPRRWPRSSPSAASAPSPPRSTTSSTWNRSRSPASRIIKVFFHPQGQSRSRRGAAGRRLAVRAALAAHRHDPAHSSCATTPPACPSCSSSISSDTLPEQQLYDLRLQLHPHPDGHRAGRQLSPALRRPPAPDHRWTSNPQALYAQGLSATDVVNAINAQSLILPSGTVKIGAQEYTVRLNSAPRPGRRLQPPAHPADQRHHRLRPRRGPRPRRLRRPDQHRAPQRRARRAAHGAQERRLLHPRHRATASRRFCRASVPRCPPR